MVVELRGAGRCSRCNREGGYRMCHIWLLPHERHMRARSTQASQMQ